MPFFGQFLVESKIIDESTLLNALVRQLEGMPAVATLIYEHKLLEPSDQLRVFERQWLTGIEHRRACIELGMWSQHLEHEIKRLLGSMRQPLGQILVEMGALPLSALSEALEKFLAVYPTQKANVTKHQEYEKFMLASKKTPTNSLVTKYCVFFDESRYVDLLELAKNLGSPSTGLEPVFTALASKIRPLVFATRYAGMTISENIWSKLMSTLPFLSKLDSSATSAIELTWNLRCAAIGGTDENTYIDSKECRQLYEDVVNSLSTTRKIA